MGFWLGSVWVLVEFWWVLVVSGGFGWVLVDRERGDFFGSPSECVVAHKLLRTHRSDLASIFLYTSECGYRMKIYEDIERSSCSGRFTT